MMTVDDAAYHVGHDYPGGVVSLAPRLDKHPATLNQELSGTGTAKLGLRTAVRMTQLTGDLRILNAFAQEVGAMVLPLPDLAAAGPDAFKRLGETSREFSEFVTSVCNGCADGQVTRNELADARKQWGELVAMGQHVLAMMETMHRAGQPGAAQHAGPDGQL